MEVKFLGTDHSGSGHFHKEYKSECGRYVVNVRHNSYTRAHVVDSNFGASSSETASVTGRYEGLEPFSGLWAKRFAHASGHNAYGYANGPGPHYVGSLWFESIPFGLGETGRLMRISMGKNKPVVWEFVQNKPQTQQEYRNSLYAKASAIASNAGFPELAFHLYELQDFSEPVTS